MSTIKIKTTINCMGCVSKVKPFLDREQAIESWEVNINNPNKILKIKSNGASTDEIISLLNKIGFKAEKMD